MAIIIGGPPSTGSSLVANILNRHPEIYCGPESYLFTKAKLYTDWNKNKHRMSLRGIRALRSSGWHMYNGLELHPYLSGGAGTEDLIQLLDASSDFKTFCNTYYAKVLSFEKKSAWAEKTPANVFHFNDIRDQFDDSKLILTIRNPYEMIASLINRGLPVFQAVGYTLSNYSASLLSLTYAQPFILRYENLIVSPDESLNNLCNYIEVDLHENMMRKAQEDHKMVGWQHHESDRVQKVSKGRFANLTEEVRNEVLDLINAMSTNPRCSYFLGQSITVKDICMHFDYEWLQMPINTTTKRNWRLSRWKDMLQRTRRTYPTHFLNYPIVIS